MACRMGRFGQHDPTSAGYGCGGCDALAARLHAKHVGPAPCGNPYADGMRDGWAWSVAITGMFEAIRDAHAEPVRFSGRYFDDDFGPCD